MTDKFEKIKEIKQLLDDGLINDQEYSQLKKELLQNNDNNQKSSNRNKVPKCLKPFYFLEKRLLEPTENTINRLAIFSILERLGALALVIGVLSFTFGAQERRNNDVFTAWQTITSAHDQSGSGGRIRALQFLNSRPWRFPWIGWTEKDWYWNDKEKKCEEKRLLGRRWQREPLNGLSVSDAFLSDIHLCGAKLQGANFEDATLKNTKLQGANLKNAKLQGANLKNANLQDTELLEANFQGANFRGTNLQDTELQEANLQDTELQGANLQGAMLVKANLQGAMLDKADLQGAYLWGTNLQGAYLDEANLQGANLWGRENLSNSQIKSACFWQDAIYTEADFNKEKNVWIPKNKQANQKKIKDIKQAETSNASNSDECREIWKND